MRVEPVPTDESTESSSLSTRLCTTAIPSVSNIPDMKGAFLCESDDYGPMGGGKFQLQTEDQISGKNVNNIAC